MGSRDEPKILQGDHGIWYQERMYDVRMMANYHRLWKDKDVSYPH